MLNVFQAFGKKLKVNYGALRFYIDNEYIHREQSPRSSGIENGDLINCKGEQVGWRSAIAAGTGTM